MKRVMRFKLYDGTVFEFPPARGELQYAPVSVAEWIVYAALLVGFITAVLLK